LYIGMGAATIFIILIIWLIIIELRFRKFFRGKKATDLEDVMNSLYKELKNLNSTQEEIKKYLETVEKRLRKSIQNLNTVRFNPFENSGSNQSFAIAFLNEEGDGVVISSLYSREKVNVYAKPIKNYKSEYTLSEEEEKAINTEKI
jgi:hypothetical protein